MRLLMLSWEYPPLAVGGIARHVHDLSSALARRGIEVTVLTVGGPGLERIERRGPLTVRRALPGHPHPHDFIGHIMQLNLNLLQEALGLTITGERFDLAHAHDWVTAYAGKAVKHGLGIPLVATIHATEYGRNNGLHNSLQSYISDAEWWLCYEAWRVICCSRYMAAEVQRVFQLPGDKVRIVKNGVNPEGLEAGPIPPGFRARFAAPDESIIFFVGRLVPEKGVDVLLDAMPRVLAACPRTKLVVSGRGGHGEALREHARRLGIFHRVLFADYLDDAERNLLYRLAGAAVFPSLYEPFGIVALEAMAAGAPVVVSDTGGISEIVEHGRNGLKAQTGNPVSLAENIIWLLQHPGQASAMAREAMEDARRGYDWNELALETIGVYEDVLGEDLVRAPLPQAAVPESPQASPAVQTALGACACKSMDL
ncbi:MAG: glycosyltransferase family 4 protein [Patescibacteria group bacterium]